MIGALIQEVDGINGTENKKKIIEDGLITPLIDFLSLRMSNEVIFSTLEAFDALLEQSDSSDYNEIATILQDR